MTLTFMHRLIERLVARLGLSYITIYRGEGRVLFHRFRLIETRTFGIYLHKFIDDDWDDLHNHPWWFGSIILAGRYLERRPGRRDRVRGWLSIGIHRPSYRHTTKLLDGRPCWTLMVRGQKICRWGFFTAGGAYRNASGMYHPTWRPWREENTDG